MVLSIFTFGAMGAAFLALRGGAASGLQAGPSRLFPEMAERINDLSEVRLDKGGKSATLKRDGGQWKLADRGGYPALFERVKELALSVADLEIEEVKTKKRENHARLGLEWPATSSDGTKEDEPGLLTFMDSSGKEVVSLVVGKSEWRGSKSKVYVRRADDDQVYLCAPRQPLAVDPEAKRWIDAKLIDLAIERVQKVSIEHADGELVEVGRSASDHTKFVVQNMPPGQSERYEGVANGVAQALAGLQLDDVRPAGEIDFSKEPVARTRFRCVDGLEVVAEIAKVEGKTWIRIASNFAPRHESPAQPAESPTGARGESEAGPAPPRETEDEGDVGKEAEELNQRLVLWAFEISSYKAETLTRRMKDLLAEPTGMGAGDAGLDDLVEGLGTAATNEQESVEAPSSPDDEVGTESLPQDAKPKTE
ncbi:MAG: DUF4340 domain-containing protein [Planctomycetes bacterium]|nr:DUF4340 domain-containing protein [Planctomycetota bacterium]